MATLAQRITDLATRIATELKAHKVFINNNATDLAALTTTAKGNLVAAINEVRALAAGNSGAAINDADFYIGNNRLMASSDTSWPTADGRPDGVRLTLTAGYETAADIPPYLMAAVKLAMSAMFENRTNPDLSAAERAADQFRPIL